MTSSPGSASAALLRELAGALPETREQDHLGTPSFRVRGKIFAQLADCERAALIKLSPPEQARLVSADPLRFCTPAHWAKFGWTYVRFEGTSAAEFRVLLEQSWRLIAPRALAAAFEAASPPARKSRE